jgi:threonine/homoserine/homoserine lactone efflux protein
VTDAEALCRGFLQNAAARQSVVARVGPEEPSADYLAGFSAGLDSGYVAALALALGVMTGESPTALIADAQGQAAVDSAFPFELYTEAM